MEYFINEKSTDFIQQLSALEWANSGDSTWFKNVTGAKLCMQAYNHISGKSKIDEIHAETILSINEYCKKHPRATEKELTSMLTKEIDDFKVKIKSV